MYMVDISSQGDNLAVFKYYNFDNLSYSLFFSLMQILINNPWINKMCQEHLNLLQLKRCEIQCVMFY